MKESELKALVSLIDDEDHTVIEHITKKINSLGAEVIPFLEDAWEENESSMVQKRIENLIHNVQFSDVQKRLLQWKLDGATNILEGLHLIATYSYPDLDYLSLKQQIKQLAEEAKLQIDDNSHPYDQIRDLNRFFFSLNRFKANKKDFHHPNNSFLNIVLESRKGNPLTLSTIYMLVAQTLGMPVYGVNFPNLFILTYKGAKKQFYINVYNSGLIFTKDDVDNYLKQIKIKTDEKFYQPCTNMEILIRSLRNLETSYEHLKQDNRIQEIQNLLDLLSD